MGALAYAMLNRTGKFYTYMAFLSKIATPGINMRCQTWYSHLLFINSKLLAQQLSLLMAVAAQAANGASKPNINMQQPGLNGTNMPTQNWPGLGYQIPRLTMPSAGCELSVNVPNRKSFLFQSNGECMRLTIILMQHNQVLCESVHKQQVYWHLHQD